MATTSDMPAVATEAVGVGKDRRHGKPITEKWRPVYEWLENLKHKEVVKTSEISEWLGANPEVRTKLYANHSNEHIFNYIQKCHTRMLVDSRKRTGSAPVKINKKQNGITGASREERTRRPQVTRVGIQPSDIKNSHKRRKRVRGLHEANHEQQANRTRGILPNDKGKQPAGERAGGTSSNFMNPYIKMEWGAAMFTMECLSDLHDSLVELLANHPKKTSVEASTSSTPVAKRGKEPVAVYAWSYSETSPGVNHNSNISPSGGSSKQDVTRGKSPRKIAESSSAAKHETCIFRCIMDREQGCNSASVAVRPLEIGTRGRRWTTYVEGWNSLASPFKGPVAFLEQRSYRSWRATWCAYTSSVALAPLERVDQGVQKVLDIRLHPGGLPQLVCSCNAAPNELLLYNLSTGRAKELSGHNCQIQAVEYALEGERIVSCGTNILKVWDSSLGTCLFTMGPRDDEGTPGHKKKISAMAVHHLQSCLVATSGGEGESELLLWNVRTGELASDLNVEMRQRRSSLPSMDAMKFCHDNLLICGSDSADSQPAVVQIWDVDAIRELMTFPANDSYITCLNTNPSGSTIITGGGDGTVGLFDLRTGGGIARLPLGVKCEATSVAFSSCGKYFHASSTANNSLVWDTRMMPMEPGLRPIERPIPTSKLSSWVTRPLHCLSHGDPMPTTQNAGQLPGYVDEGDGGVNDARWCQSAPVLVTASGNGSIALWDVALGQPCVRLLSSHSRCINTVAISPDDQLICSGGDDQKVVLYESFKGESIRGWRLTHPLSEDQQPGTRPE